MADEPKTAIEEAAAEVAGHSRRGLIPIQSGTTAASIHDQGLSTIIGGGIVWLLVTYAGARAPEGATAAIVYSSAGGLGAMIGAKVPGAYRSAIQYAALLLAGLYGIDLGTGHP